VKEREEEKDRERGRVRERFREREIQRETKGEREEKRDCVFACARAHTHACVCVCVHEREDGKGGERETQMHIHRGFSVVICCPVHTTLHKPKPNTHADTPLQILGDAYEWAMRVGALWKLRKGAHDVGCGIRCSGRVFDLERLPSSFGRVFCSMQTQQLDSVGHRQTGDMGKRLVRFCSA